MDNPKRVGPLFLLYLLLFLPASCDRPMAAAQGGSGSDSTVISERESLQHFLPSIPPLLERAKVPGISLAIIEDGELQWSGSFGVSSAGSGAPVNETTLFEAASLSKPLCAYAALRMVDRGELRLDDPLVNYIPDSTLARRFLGEGFILLQKVLEEICQCDYANLMDQEILHPLGMANSDFRWRPEYLERIAQRHDEAGEMARLPTPREVHAAGTLLTTAEDYGKFLLALMEGTGLSSTSEEELFRTQFRFPGRHGSEISWGLSVGLDETEGARAFWHHGDNRTTKAFFLAMPERRAAVVYFANGENGLGFVEEIVQGALGSDDPVRSFRNWTNYPRISR